jgi:enoyl-CoA hydratase
MANDVVLYEKQGPIGFITINRPEMRNPLNMSVFRSLDGILDTVSADDEIRVVIVSGAGNSFVAGADISELLSFNSQVGWAASRYEQSVFNKLEGLRKPSIAAINGFAMGGGLELALACTFRLASTKAKLGFPELGLGITPAFGGTQRLARVVGYAKTLELILFRSILDAEAALGIGLVNLVVGHEELPAKAKEWAQSLAELSPVAVRLELELFLRTQSKGFDEGLALESALGALAVASDEAKELLGRFVAKRKEKQG